MTRRASIAELVIADEPNTWRTAGFEVEGDGLLLGTVRIRLAGASDETRIKSWALRELTTTELDGLPTTLSDEPTPEPAGPHPNGVTRIDHIVAFSPSLERTIPALEAAGLDFRRLREEPTPAGAPRQAFFRLGAEILEVIEHPSWAKPAIDADAPAGFWGLAVLVEDLDTTARYLGPLLGEARAAVQPGRQIATLRREAGLALPVAFMTPG